MASGLQGCSPPHRCRAWFPGGTKEGVFPIGRGFKRVALWPPTTVGIDPTLASRPAVGGAATSRILKALHRNARILLSDEPRRCSLPRTATRPLLGWWRLKETATPPFLTTSSTRGDGGSDMVTVFVPARVAHLTCRGLIDQRSRLCPVATLLWVTYDSSEPCDDTQARG